MNDGVVGGVFAGNGGVYGITIGGGVGFATVVGMVCWHVCGVAGVGGNWYDGIVVSVGACIFDYGVVFFFFVSLWLMMLLLMLVVFM